MAREGVGKLGGEVMAYILTAKEVAASAADRWKMQYGYMFHSEPMFHRGETYGGIYEKIKDETDPTKINAAIGNTSWTTVSCSECSKDVDAVAVFDVNGGEYDYHLCKDCCEKAWK